jgi:membrane fusion protein, multidrug efflux system
LTEGNLVNADTTLLTTIMSIDPMYAYFNIEEPMLLRILKMKREGQLPQKMGAVEVDMGLADDIDRKFPLKGVLDFSDNTVKRQTGTIEVRGTFENPYEMPNKPPVLMPGLFVRVQLRIGMPHKAFLVTERAIGTDQGQKYVYVVTNENKTVRQRVTLGHLVDGLQVIEDGLKAEDRVVVNGIQRIRPDLEVKAEEVDMASLVAPQ